MIGRVICVCLLVRSSVCLYVCLCVCERVRAFVLQFSLRQRTGRRQLAIIIIIIIIIIDSILVIA